MPEENREVSIRYGSLASSFIFLTSKSHLKVKNNFWWRSINANWIYTSYSEEIFSFPEDKGSNKEFRERVLSFHLTRTTNFLFKRGFINNSCEKISKRIVYIVNSWLSNRPKFENVTLSKRKINAIKEKLAKIIEIKI